MSENSPPTLYLKTPGNRQDWSFHWTHAAGDTRSYLTRHLGIPDSEQKPLVLKPIRLKELFSDSLSGDVLKSAQDVLIEGLKRAGDISVSKSELWQRFVDLPEEEAKALAQSSLDALLGHVSAEEVNSTARPPLSRRAMGAVILTGFGLASISVGTGVLFNGGRKKQPAMPVAEPVKGSVDCPDGVINDVNAKGKVVPVAVEEKTPVSK